MFLCTTFHLLIDFSLISSTTHILYIHNFAFAICIINTKLFPYLDWKTHLHKSKVSWYIHYFHMVRFLENSIYCCNANQGIEHPLQSPYMFPKVKYSANNGCPFSCFWHFLLRTKLFWITADKQYNLIFLCLLHLTHNIIYS